MPKEQTMIKGNDPLTVIANTCRPTELFLARLAAEKKLHEYTLYRRKRIKNGDFASEINRGAYREFGWLGQLGERQAYLETVLQNLSVKQTGDAERQARCRDKRRNVPFESAFSSLPSHAPVEKEIDWVRNHPAMSRKARASKRVHASGETILITKEDLLSPPHGPCPSKCAANMLQNWVSEPEKFFTGILAEQKKGLKGKAAESKSGSTDKDETVADIDDLMELMADEE